MNIWRPVLRRWRDDKGQSLVLVALAFVVLCGMVGLTFDIGNGYMQKQNLQAAVDAGALAGAQYLDTAPTTDTNPQSTAKSNALDIAQKNDKQGLYHFSVDTSNNKFIVSGKRRVSTFFAGVLGINAVTVTAKAAAKYGAVGAAYGFPVGLTYSKMLSMEQSEQYPTCLNDPTTGKNTCVPQQITGKSYLGASDLYGYLDFGNQGGSVLRKAFSQTIPLAPLKVGDTVTADSGAKNGPVEQGIDTLLSNGPVLVTVPILNDTPTGNGSEKKTFVVKGFASFMITGYIKDGDNKYVEGYFVNGIGEGQLNPPAPNYGLTAVQLVQ